MLIKNIKWDTDGDIFETETDDGGIIKCDTLPE